MPLQPLAPRRLYRQIADQVRGLIRAGEFPVGSRLPAERDLAVQLGVSRPSVREALIALEVEGLVAVRMGSGVIVIARESAPSATPVDAPFGPFEIIRARQLIECELAALAALHASKAQVSGLREALVLMEDELAAGAMPIHGDRLFHVRGAEIAENGPLLRTVADLSLAMHFLQRRRNHRTDEYGGSLENRVRLLRARGVRGGLGVDRALESRCHERARCALPWNHSCARDARTARRSLPRSGNGCRDRRS